MKEQEELTIREARAIMRADLRKGTTCICCRQPVKQYSRPLTSSMAMALIIIYNTSQSEYIHLEETFKDMDIPSSIRGDVPKLRFWNLIEPKIGTGKEDGNPNNGYYRITEIGRRFVENKASVSSHVLLYNNTMYGYPEGCKEINIVQALKNKFNYEEIVKA